MLMISLWTLLGSQKYYNPIIPKTRQWYCLQSTFLTLQVWLWVTQCRGWSLTTNLGSGPKLAFLSFHLKLVSTCMQFFHFASHHCSSLLVRFWLQNNIRHVNDQYNQFGILHLCSESMPSGFLSSQWHKQDCRHVYVVRYGLTCVLCVIEHHWSQMSRELHLPQTELCHTQGYITYEVFISQQKCRSHPVMHSEHINSTHALSISSRILKEVPMRFQLIYSTHMRVLFPGHVFWTALWGRSGS